MNRSKLSVSKGNMKLGSIWNLNLPPCQMCQGRPCYNEGCCYNKKAWDLYPSVRTSWSRNWNYYKQFPNKFFKTISQKIKASKNPPKHFRWHAAGDIPDQKYFVGMKRIAREFPEIKFLVYTKNYNLIFRDIPKNLQVVISAWPGVELKKSLRRFPVAWMLDGRETRHTNRKRKTVSCPGSCEKCKSCWNLSKVNKDVIFKKH